jgi:hypothetical protein
MAAVTVDNQQQVVFGNKVVILAQIDIASNGDTWDTTLSNIDWWGATPATSSASQIGGTKDGGTITFATGGAEANALIMVVGDGA